MNKEKIWNICRYFLAVPAGILGYLASSILLLLSSRIYPEYMTVWDWIMNFIWKNFIHILAFFWFFNSMLPKHKFILTLILSTILSTLSIILLIVYIIYDVLTLEIFFGFVLMLSAFIVSCVLSRENIFGDFS